jgi:uncharacterized protein (TIRG00374 family)
MTSNHDPMTLRHKIWLFSKRRLGYLLAIICLIWLFHDLQWDRFFHQLTRIHWAWIGPAVLCDLLSYVCEGLRWHLLLRPLGILSPLRTTQAIYAGLFTNEILPLRMGELVRTYLVSRWLQLKFTAIVPSIIIERLFDGLWLAMGIGLTTIFVNLPADLLDAADIFGIIILIMTLLFIVLLAVGEKFFPAAGSQIPADRNLVQRLGAILDKFITGIKTIGLTPGFYAALFISSLVLIFQIGALWLMMHAYGLKLSLWIGAAVLIIEHLGNVIPNAPSNVGTYQFFIVLALSIFGVDKTTATGFSIVVFILLSIPYWLLGLVAVSLTGMKFKDIRSEVSKIRKLHLI